MCIRDSNYSGASQDITLSVEEIPEGWEGSFSASSKQVSVVHVKNEQTDDSVCLLYTSENMPSDVVRSASTLLDDHAVSIQMQDTATSTLFTPLFLRQFSSQTNMVASFNEMCIRDSGHRGCVPPPRRRL